MARDGYRPGKAVPAWSLPDTSGQVRKTPGKDHWQLLIFTNHALVAFPNILAGIRQLALTAEELEIIILATLSRELCEATIKALDLTIPIVPVNQEFYHRFNVRIMPFIFVLDPTGTVHWVGIANKPGELVYIWQMVQNRQQLKLSEVRQ